MEEGAKDNAPKPAKKRKKCTKTIFSSNYRNSVFPCGVNIQISPDSGKHFQIGLRLYKYFKKVSDLIKS
jgi:hypothetical protein